MKNVRLSKGYLLVSLLLLAIIVLVISGFTGRKTKPVENVTNVKVATVRMSSIESNVEYGSNLQPASQIAVTSKISGKIASVKVDVGQSVKKGDVLFTLDSNELQDQYGEAQGALDSAEANLIHTSDSALAQQLIQAQEAQKQAQVQYDDAKRNLDTTQALFAQGAETKQDLDDMQSKFNDAEAQLNSANDTLNLINNKLGPQTTNVAQAQVQQAQASLKLAADQLSDAVITSPIDGIVSARNVDPGEMVSSATNAFSIIDDSSLMAEINVTDNDLTKIQIGQVIPIKVDALDNQSFTGTVDSISPYTDPKTNLYTIKIKLSNQNNLLKSGMIVRVMFPDQKKDHILVVPNGAITVENTVQYVYSVVNGTVKKVPVQTGISDSSNTEITSGLKAGADVIVEGQSFLNPGEQVHMIK